MRSFGVRQLAAALPQPACWLGIVLAIEIPVSKLAERKAAASCRTPKRAAPAQEEWALTKRGEQGVGNAYGGEDCSGIVDAHDVCAAQDGGDHGGGVTRQE